MKRLRKFTLKIQLLLMILPLVLGGVILVGFAVGAISSSLAYQGVTKASRDDLGHLAQFSVDLLNSHYNQFEVYQEDKKNTARKDLSTLVNVAVSIVEGKNGESKKGGVSLAAARKEAAKALKEISVGQSGYVYVMNSRGDLLVHIAQEGQNIYDSTDENGRYFIREMCQRALSSGKGEVLTIEYPWKNTVLGDKAPRKKLVAYRYYAPWDWIVAAGSYVDETYEDAAFEKRAFEELKDTLKKKGVGTTGYIYAVDKKGIAVIHPFREGESLIDQTDHHGGYFIREMLEKKSGWIEYPWQNEGDPAPRMKIVRYEYFKPWDWVVAVGSYENEFLHDAEVISSRVIFITFVAVGLAALLCVLLVYMASLSFTMPIVKMTQIIRRVHGNMFGGRMDETGSDELSELARAYNRMTDALGKHMEMEATLAQQGKMASLGVLSSGVAHEINNPLGVILGYAAYLENKLDPGDPNFKYVQEIKREAKRSKKIVQDLLSYARAPRPAFETVEIPELLNQIADFASNHSDMAGVVIVRHFDSGLPAITADADHLKQVAINVILNAGAAMKGNGTMTISAQMADEGKVRIIFEDTGPGIDPEVLPKIFEPFFTTRQSGTGLGLSITKQIIDRHHGAIEVESEAGRGTRVIITLPVRQEDF
ncbi:HAMP domain-containing protein [bacterium]|nr:MAG: HAMP domain-containing protein [bacterium]